MNRDINRLSDNSNKVMNQRDTNRLSGSIHGAYQFNIQNSHLQQLMDPTGTPAFAQEDSALL